MNNNNTDDNENGIYNLEFSTSLRNFKSQTSGLDLGKIQISCVSLDDFRVKLFDKIKNHLKREIVWDDDMLNPQWCDKVTPDIDDLAKFIAFQNKNTRRIMLLDSIKSGHLVAWIEDRRDICIHIFSYSNSVSNQALWTIVQKKLLVPENRDRSNASSNSSVLALAHRLKEIHGHVYMSSDINWLLWANTILSMQPHEQDAQVTLPPPSSIIHLFACARSNPEEQLMNVRQNISIGKEINADMVSSVETLNEIYREMKGSIDRLNQLVSVFHQHLNSIQNRSTARVGMLDAFQNSVEPRESGFGREILDSIPNMPDLEHLENFPNENPVVIAEQEEDYLDYEFLEERESRYIHDYIDENE